MLQPIGRTGRGIEYLLDSMEADLVVNRKFGEGFFRAAYGCRYKPMTLVLAAADCRIDYPNAAGTLPEERVGRHLGIEYGRWREQRERAITLIGIDQGSLVLQGDAREVVYESPPDEFFAIRDLVEVAMRQEARLDAIVARGDAIMGFKQ